jgi:protein-tyrosine phosphatase
MIAWMVCTRTIPWEGVGEAEPGCGSSAARAAGSATIAPPEPPVLPAGVEVQRVPLDDVQDVAFWRRINAEGLDGTPLYFRPFIEAKPERCAAAVAAIAHAAPGGVIFHCRTGRDRTGLVALLVLALAGIPPDAIADDYELSARELPALFAALGEQDQARRVGGELIRHGTRARAAVLDAIAGLNIAGHLRGGGLRDADIAALRARMLGGVSPGKQERTHREVSSGHAAL